MNRGHRHIVGLLLAIVPPTAAFAQHQAERAPTPACTATHAAMGHCAVPTVPPARQASSACTPEHAAMGHCTPASSASTPRHDHHSSHEAHPPAAHDNACSPEHDAMGHCTPASSAAAPRHGHHSAHGAHAPGAQGNACSPEHAAMGHCTPAGSAATPRHDHHSAHGAHAPGAQGNACSPEHAAMGHCASASPELPREPVPAVTPADRAAAFPVLAHGDHAHGPAHYAMVKFDRFEAWDGRGTRGQAWEGSASVGGDIHRLWLRSSGERSAGTTTRSSAELRVSRAVASWWDLVAGVRHDFRPAASRTRAVIGVQGIAPYQFEVSALAYFGDGGGLTAKLEAEYDMRFSNRLVLQPLLELELHSQDDPARGTGSGLSKAEAGLRLRYEFSRRFAPYVGLVHERSFGATARSHEADGEAARDTRVVAGVRFWF